MVDTPSVNPSPNPIDVPEVVLHPDAGWVAQLLCNMVALHDLDTAGHQQRVAALVATMARHLRMDDVEVETLRLAALVHDIGKLSVPSQVLSKSGPLRDFEREFLRSHVLAGYHLIEDVACLTPIASIVLQHHERLDGSGYPQGLVGDQIDTHARLLAVADVVEAMASHRPYRRPLGLEVALAEISENSGRLFDPAAVSSCVEVFRTDLFEFPDPVPSLDLETWTLGCLGCRRRASGDGTPGPPWEPPNGARCARRC